MVVGDVKYKVAYEHTDVVQVLTYLQLYGYASYEKPEAVSNGVLVYAGMPDGGIGFKRLFSGLHIRVLHSPCFYASVCIIGYDLRTEEAGRSLTDVLRDQSIDMCKIVGELLGFNRQRQPVKDYELSGFITVSSRQTSGGVEEHAQACEGEEEVCRNVLATPAPESGDTYENTSLQQDAALFLMHLLHLGGTTFNQDFLVRVGGKLECTSNHIRDACSDHFYLLALQIGPNESTLVQAIRTYLDEEDVAVDCGIDGCEAKGARKAGHFTALPNNLVIQLKRFDKRNVKLSHHVTFPLALSAPRDLPVLNDKNFPTYSLAAVVVHVGDTTSSGHYMCYVRQKQNTGHDLWWRMDDLKINIVDEADVLKAEAYLLFYTNATAFEPHTSPVGLPNLGATCYRNVIFQSLHCMHGVREYLEGHISSCEQSSVCLICELAGLNKSDAAAVYPVGFEVEVKVEVRVDEATSKPRVRRAWRLASVVNHTAATANEVQVKYNGTDDVENVKLERLRPTPPTSKVNMDKIQPWIRKYDLMEAKLSDAEEWTEVVVIVISLVEDDDQVQSQEDVGQQREKDTGKLSFQVSCVHPLSLGDGLRHESSRGDLSFIGIEGLRPRWHYDIFSRDKDFCGWSLHCIGETLSLAELGQCLVNKGDTIEVDVKREDGSTGWQAERVACCHPLTGHFSVDGFDEFFGPGDMETDWRFLKNSDAGTPSANPTTPRAVPGSTDKVVSSGQKRTSKRKKEDVIARCN